MNKLMRYIPKGYKEDVQDIRKGEVVWNEYKNVGIQQSL